jgi:uncharacterized protein
MIVTTPHERAYIGPFFLFLALLLFSELLGKLGAFSSHWLLADSKYWVFPAQIAVCAWALWHWRKLIELSAPKGIGFAALIGVLSLVVWVAPQQWLGFPPRTAGFDPAYFGADGPAYWGNVALRMIRMVIIVPLVEEIFWRGYCVFL